MKQQVMAPPVSAEQIDQEDRDYRDYLNDIHLQKNPTNPRGTATPNDDDLLIALEHFTSAAGRLAQIWTEMHSDGNHPIVTCGVYPFGDLLFPEIARLIEGWDQAACSRAFAAVGTVIEYDQPKANNIALIAEAIVKAHGFQWDVCGEHNACVGVYLPHPHQRFEITFGGAAETFGASVTLNGEDYAYLETNLDIDKVSAEKLALALVTVVQQWIANGMPTWTDAVPAADAPKWRNSPVAVQASFRLLNPVCVANEFGSKPGFIREAHTFEENGDLRTCIECGVNDGTVRAGCETERVSVHPSRFGAGDESEVRNG